MSLFHRACARTQIRTSLQIRPQIQARRTGPRARPIITPHKHMSYKTAVSSIATMYNDKIFISKSNSPTGEVSSDTRFHYHQQDNIVWAEYSGGSITRGSLIATVDATGALDMRYQHVNVENRLMTGKCISTPERLEDGRLRMHEKWTWTSGDCSSGESVVEEATATT